MRVKRWELYSTTGEIIVSHLKKRLNEDDVHSAILDNSDPLKMGTFDTYEEAKRELDKTKITARRMRTSVPYLLFEGCYIELAELEIDEDGDEDYIQSTDMEFAELDLSEDIRTNYFE